LALASRVDRITPRYQLNRRQSGQQGQPARITEQIFLAPSGNKKSGIHGRSACYYVTNIGNVIFTCPWSRLDRTELQIVLFSLTHHKKKGRQ